jgi:hypothetical protein
VTQPTLSQYASLAGTNNFLGTNTILNSPIVTQATLPSLSGYASITGTNTFTGVNTFSQLVNIPAQIYNPASTYGNSSATQSFVQQAVLDGTSTQLISVGVSDTTGFSATSFTFTQVLNTKQQTNNYYMTDYADNNFTIGSPINFTLTFPSFLYPTGSTPNTLNAAGGSNTNVYCDSTGQSFNCGMSFLNNTQIRCSSGGTTTGGAKDYSISATFIIIWT